MIRYLFFLVLLFLTISNTHSQNLPQGIIQPTPFMAPEITLSDIDGTPFKSSDHKGKWLFVHFWASWCGPCRKEVPAIEKMMHMLKDEQFVMVFINTAEDEDTIFSFLGIHGPDLLPLMDSDGQLTEQWKPRGLPATYLVDPKGIVRYQALGGRPWHTPNYIKFLRNIINQPLSTNAK